GAATRTGGKSPSEDLPADPAIAGDPQGSLTIAEMPNAAEAATATSKILPEALPDAVATQAVEGSGTNAGEQAVDTDASNVAAAAVEPLLALLGIAAPLKSASGDGESSTGNSLLASAPPNLRNVKRLAAKGGTEAEAKSQTPDRQASSARAAPAVQISVATAK